MTAPAPRTPAPAPAHADALPVDRAGIGGDVVEITAGAHSTDGPLPD